MRLDHPVHLPALDGPRARRRAQRARARAEWCAGEQHLCGLRHWTGGDGWSPLAAILWWMLRSGPR